MSRVPKTSRARETLSAELRGEASLARKLADALASAGAVERYTHLFHTYPASLHPDAARELLRDFGGASVLDPFCGGGTVLVEARAAGMRAFGRDVSPVAVRVARARSAKVAPERLTKFRARARALTAEARAASTRGELPPTVILRKVEEWYAAHVLRELEALRRGVAASDADVRALLEAVFSSLLVKVSWRASDTKSKRAKHVRPAGTAAVLFHKKARELGRGLEALALDAPPDTPEPEVALGDARSLALDAPVDLALTSPPYPSTYDYLPMQHLRHVWLGDRPDPKREIGARRNWRGGEKTAREAWRADTERWTASVARVLAPGGQLVVVIGDGFSPNGVVDSAAPTLAAAEKAGLAYRASATLERPDHGGRTNRREHLFAFRKR